MSVEQYRRRKTSRFRHRICSPHSVYAYYFRKEVRDWENGETLSYERHNETVYAMAKSLEKRGERDTYSGRHEADA